MTRYIYLHGFASGPGSAKAQDLKHRLASLGLTLEIPDLNQGDFTHLTLSRQLQQVQDLILAEADEVILVGSSLGGLTAAWLGEQPALSDRILALVLLAPAFQFLAQWLPRLGQEQLSTWRQTGTLAVFHHSQGQPLPLHYGFLEDAQRYDDTTLCQPIPTLILHGRQDEVIAVDASRTYARSRPWVRLIELDSDHALGNVQSEIWQQVRVFGEEWGMGE